MAVRDFRPRRIFVRFSQVGKRGFRAAGIFGQAPLEGVVRMSFSGRTWNAQNLAWPF
jgi:hypothetical protein